MPYATQNGGSRASRSSKATTQRYGRAASLRRTGRRRASAGKAAGACTIIVSYSQDNGATFANMPSSLVVPNSVVPTVTFFAPSVNVFPAGCLLIVRVVTDGAFDPIANDLFVNLEVTAAG